MSKINWKSVKDLKSHFREVSDSALYEMWRDRDPQVSTPEAIIAMGREMTYRDNVDQWRKGGRQLGVAENELDDWVAHVDEQPGGTTFADMYQEWRSTRK